MQPEVVIYTTPTCTWCPAAKRWLDDHGVRYTEHDITRDPVRATEVFRLTGQGAVPVIRVGQQVVVGFDPLQLAKLIPLDNDGKAGAGNGNDSAGRLSLGMAAQSLTPEKAAQLGLPAPFGVVVGPVRPGGPAAGAGIQEGDVLIGVGSYTLQNLAQLQSLVAAKQPGDRLSIRIWRRGEELDATIEFPTTEGASEAAGAPETAGAPAAAGAPEAQPSAENRA